MKKFAAKIDKVGNGFSVVDKDVQDDLKAWLKDAPNLLQGESAAAAKRNSLAERDASTSGSDSDGSAE